MDRDLILRRRPLLTLEQDGFEEALISAREPHRADRITNKVRRLGDLFATRRFEKSKYNRRQRNLYHGRIRQDQRKARPGQRGSSEKRTAPEKRVGTRLRRR